MQEKYISDHLYGDGLARCAYQTVDSSCRQQAAMRRSQSLPNTRQHDEHGEDQADGSPPEDVAERHNEEIGEAKRDDSYSREHSQLVVVEVEFLAEQWEHRCDGQRAGDGNPSEQPLADDHSHCTSCQSILRGCAG